MTDVIGLFAINDLSSSSGTTTGDAVIAGHCDLIAHGHAKNVKIGFATPTPIRTDLGDGTGVFGAFTATTFPLEEPVRRSLDAWIPSSRAHDGAIDFDEAVSTPGRLALLLAHDEIAPDRGNDDRIHLNDFGQRPLADATEHACSH